MNGYINVVRNVYKRVYDNDMGGLFSSNEHAENTSNEHAKKIKKAKEIFEQQQRILNANMLVNRLMREGRSTDYIAHEIMVEYTPNVYEHISNKDVITAINSERRERYYW